MADCCPDLVLSWFLPKFWDLGIASYFVLLSVGGYIAFRLLLFRSVEADKASWKIWCLGMSIIYLLALFENHDVLIRF
jgi:hypothetical protein